jgi:glucose/arabinose dehydrogenase
MQMARLGVTLLALVATASCHAQATQATGPRAIPVPAAIAAGVTLTRVATGLSKPVALAFAPGDTSDRLFVVEKTGTIRIMRNGTIDPARPPFLDLTTRVSTASEQGLLGLAFHPRYAENRRFFVNLTDRKGDTRVLALATAADDPDRADPASERELLFVDQPYSNHNGGHLAFGPDGLLYVGLGDGGSAGDPKGNGQNPTARLGKMLALNVDAGALGEPAIVALGLRNPWRYSFDRVTGDLWIGDVGQNHFEEVDVLTPAMRAATAPTNFGWNLVEGLHCYPDPGCDQRPFTPPVIEYDHDDGCSITSGVVYRGRALPALDGLYFYADYCSAMIRSLRWPGPGKPVTDVWDWRAALDPVERLTNLSSFGEDAAGELYLLSLDGDVYRFDPKPRASGPPSP